MEKLDYLVWLTNGDAGDARTADAAGKAEQCARLGTAVAAAVEADGSVVGASVCTADTDDVIPKPSLLMGRGPELAGVVSVWLDSVDHRTPIEAAIAATGSPFDGYLVTESVPQHRGDRDWADGEVSPGVMHFTWFPKPDRLTDEAFFHGWHVLHTPASALLHPLRWSYTRDAVVRALTPSAPPVRAIVFESFRSVDDYVDPDRLYGSAEALEETMENLPLYADYEDINSRPLNERILRSLPSR